MKDYHAGAEDILLRAGVVTLEGCRKARQLLARTGAHERHFPQAVADLGLASREAVLRALSEAWELPCELDASPGRLAPAFLDPERPFDGRLELAWCRRRWWAPLYCDDKELVFACAEPPDPVALDEAACRSGLELRPRLALAGDIAAILAAADPDNARLGPGSDVRSLIEELVAEGRIEEAGELDPAAGPAITDVLTGGGLLTREQLVIAVRQTQTAGVSLPAAVVRLGFASKRRVLEALSRAWGVPAVDFEADPPPVERVLGLRAPFFVWDSALPFDERGGKLCVAMANPRNRRLIEHIGELSGREVAPFLALPEDIKLVAARIGTR